MCQANSSFDVPVREVVMDNENGFLVQFGNIEKLAFSINELIADDALRDRMGKAGRALVENISVRQSQRCSKLFEFKNKCKNSGTN